MEITSFNIQENRTELNIVIEDAASVTSVYLWTADTYKDYSLGIDLTTKLTGSTTENITLTLSELGIAYFDGVYFIEAEDPDEVSVNITSDLTRYKECVLDKLVATSACNECLDQDSEPIVASHAMIHALEYAVELRYVDEIFNILGTLNKYCDNECKTCGDYDNIIDNNYFVQSSNDE